MTSQLPNNYDVSMGIVVSNSLDIGFIDGDIHGQLWKKMQITFQQSQPITVTS